MHPASAATWIAAGLTVLLSLPGIVLGDDEAEGTDRATGLCAAEEAFARTMADRDHEAFVSFLAVDAVFFGRHGEIRVREPVGGAIQNREFKTQHFARISTGRWVLTPDPNPQA